VSSACCASVRRISETICLAASCKYLELLVGGLPGATTPCSQARTQLRGCYDPERPGPAHDRLVRDVLMKRYQLHDSAVRPSSPPPEARPSLFQRGALEAPEDGRGLAALQADGRCSGRLARRRGLPAGLSARLLARLHVARDGSVAANFAFRRPVAARSPAAFSPKPPAGPRTA